MKSRYDFPKPARNRHLKKVAPKPDAYLPNLREHWDALAGMYTAFEDRAPIIEFNVASGQIRVYSAGEYLEGLSGRTREEAKRQYKKAAAEGALMVFVRDDSKEILRSYIFAPAKELSMRARRKEGGISSSNRRR
jgi:hypothetical protein